jgi:invasion protein IalB
MIIRKLGATVGLLGGLSLLALAASTSFSAQAQTSLRGAVDGAKTAAPPASQHVESVNFDHWVVTCQDVASKKACVGNLQLRGSDGNAVANWQIGFDKDSRLMSVFQVSTGLAVKSKDNKVSTGLLIKNGVEVKLGSSAARRLSYVSCNPQICEAAAPVDEAFVKDAAAAATTAVTIYTSDGNALPFTFDSKGLDKALVAVASKTL